MPTTVITDEAAGQRLDLFLVSQMETSRAQIQKLIKLEVVQVNDAPARAKTLLVAGDKVFFPEVDLSPPKKTSETPILDIVYQDDDLLVINKPAGLLVHDATERETRSTLVDGLLEMFPEISEIGDNPARPGIVHRLDKDVSGLMVVAKTQETFEHLKKQFQDRTVHKEYLTLVYGELPKPDGMINLKIARSKARGRMVAKTGDQEGKEAITEYTVITRYTFTTYARIKIHTGRTHQIRVHMLAIEHPIVGDKLYKLKKMKINPLEMNRIFLHSTRLQINLIDGTPMKFEAPLPAELEAVLQTLK